MRVWIDIENEWLLRHRRLRKTLIFISVHPWITLMLVALVLGILTLALRPVLMPHYVEWKTARDLGKAREAAGTGDHVGARNWAQQVLRNDRGGQEEALEILIRAQTELRDPTVVRIASILWHHYPDAPEEVRLRAWEILGERLPTALLLVSWFGMDDERRREPEILQPILRRCLDEGNPGLSRHVLSLVPMPDDAALEELRLRILAASPSADERDDFARGLLVAIFRHPELAETWLELLKRVRPEQLGPRQLEQILRFVGGFPEDHVGAALETARLHMAIEPSRRDEIFLETYRRHAESDPWATARWCRTVDLDSWARQSVDLGVPADDPDDLELQAELLLGAGRREEAAGLLEEAVGDRISSWRQGLWKSWAASLGEARKPQEDARLEAVDFVTRSADVEAAIRLARAADRRGLTDLARDAWAVAFSEGNGPLPLYESVGGLLPALEEAGLERSMLAVGARVLEFEPGNLGVRIGHSYLALTNGMIDPGELIEQLLPLFERDPESLKLRITLALAHLLMDRPARAAELIDIDDLDWFSVPPSARALRIVVLRAAGRLEEAKILSEGFMLSRLLPSEQRIFRIYFEDRSPGLATAPADPALRAPTPATAPVPEPEPDEEDVEPEDDAEDGGTPVPEVPE